MFELPKRPGAVHLSSKRERLARWCTAIMLPLIAIVVSGCGEDEIRHYRAIRLEPPRATTQPSAVAHDRRMLAAIVPADERTWFFKLVGPTDAVADQAENFDRFIRSLRFGGAREVTWNVPEGWKEQPGSQSRFATFQIGSVEGPMELTVVPLGSEAGSLLENVNRWRRQLGLEAVPESDLGEVTRQIKLDGVQATIVDIVATGPAMRAGHPPVGPTKRSQPTERAAVKYTVPDGWRELPVQSAFRVASFEIVDDGQHADVSVSPLSGTAGGLLANTNRWRDQLGLAALDEAQLRQSVRSIEVAGITASYVELIGRESAGTSRQSILGVILERGEQTWFFKMTGPADLVGRQKSAFEEFVRSVQFN
jgi:hypothetical protein